MKSTVLRFYRSGINTTWPALTRQMTGDTCDSVLHSRRPWSLRWVLDCWCYIWEVVENDLTS